MENKFHTRSIIITVSNISTLTLYSGVEYYSVSLEKNTILT